MRGERERGEEGKRGSWLERRRKKTVRNKVERLRGKNASEQKKKTRESLERSMENRFANSPGT